MTLQIPVADFSEEQRALWRRVLELWALSRSRDASGVRSALHPDYVGWDMTAPLPHDRESAVRSVSGDSPALLSYDLRPLSVQIYGGQVGVVHYAYSAQVASNGTAPIDVSGKWSEVYFRQDGVWRMIAVSGRPDRSKEA